MKVKDIAAICRRENQIIIYDNTNGSSVQQYIGTGAAVYKLENLPYLNEDNIITLFDISEKKREDIYINLVQAPGVLNLEDFAPGEVIAEKLNIVITYAGTAFNAIKTADGVYFINSAYLRPFKNIEQTEIYFRQGKISYFAVKVGLLLQAVIMPLVIPAEMCNLMSYILKEKI
ncbi:hypothetical protein [Anaerotignum sp. MSJ-24]|uniref:hypothetical protein n=1 Tax=Anaerotignum sp. MSJ-24 TaxID=2841521 RepID=UPI001C113856|nr:hypothetical protein [Anaerotignum sp. MSJ-24]MBU5464954.1 hypothetical protein [Anaerotignum sp. MSJ-24]